MHRLGQMMRESEEMMEHLVGVEHKDVIGEDGKIKDTYEDWQEWDHLLDDHPDLLEATDDE